MSAEEAAGISAPQIHFGQSASGRGTTFLGDFLKVLIACGLVYLVVIVWLGMDIDRIVLFLYGLRGVLGHNFPVFFKFKGGKGVTVSVAVVLAIWDWRMIVAGLVIFFTVTLITGYVSAGSLSLITGEFIIFTVFILTGLIEIDAKWQPDCIILFALTMLLVFWQHRDNLKRLSNGTESKFVFKSKSQIAGDRRERRRKRNLNEH